MIFFICTYPICAQELYDHDLNENKLESLRKNIKHKSKKPSRWTYKDDKSWQDAMRRYEDHLAKKKGGNQANKHKPNYKSPEYIPPGENNNFNFPKLQIGSGLTIFIYIILGAGLATLIYFLFVNSGYKSNGKKYTTFDIEEVAPSEIPKTELERLLEEALKRKDFRSAVRIYYLFILKDLSEKNWIDWQKEKTNMHYIVEMRDRKESTKFGTIVNYFEFIWYGKRDINQNQFKQIQPEFTTLLKILGIK